MSPAAKRLAGRAILYGMASGLFLVLATVMGVWIAASVFITTAVVTPLIVLAIDWLDA